MRIARIIPFRLTLRYNRRHLIYRSGGPRVMGVDRRTFRTTDVLPSVLVSAPVGVNLERLTEAACHVIVIRGAASC